MNNALQLEDLNDDVLLEILYRTELKDLINLADTSYRIRELVAHYYIVPKYRFHEILVEIYLCENDKDMVLQNDSISIYGSKLASRVIRNFGNVISHIALRCEDVYDVKLLQGISSNINEY